MSRLDRLRRSLSIRVDTLPYQQRLSMRGSANRQGRDSKGSAPGVCAAEMLPGGESSAEALPTNAAGHAGPAVRAGLGRRTGWLVLAAFALVSTARADHAVRVGQQLR